jgi:hypothetical protein
MTEYPLAQRGVFLACRIKPKLIVAIATLIGVAQAG